MKKLNPIILSTLYAAGAYPFEDIEDDELKAVLSVWIIPVEPIPIQIGIKGNGSSVKALAAELSRLANAFKLKHSFPQKTAHRHWCYQIIAQCEGAISRILSRSLVPFEPEEIDAMMSCWPFIPWFNPAQRFHRSYKKGFMEGLLLPDTSALIRPEQDSDEVTEIAEWDTTPELTHARPTDGSAYLSRLSELYPEDEEEDEEEEEEEEEDEHSPPDFSSISFDEDADEEDSSSSGMSSFAAALRSSEVAPRFMLDEDAEDDEDEDEDDSGD